MNMPGGPEILVILVLALLVLGPEQLPKAMRTLGSVMAEIRKVSGGFQAEMKSAMDSFTAEADEAKDKPQSGSMASSTASTMEEADVTEVVARNEAPAELAASTGAVEVDVDDGPKATDDAAEPVRPTIDPADRAAG
jgi:sec-independent protein translocase protein TatB